MSNLESIAIGDSEFPQTITGGTREPQDPKEPIHKAILKKYGARQNQRSNINSCKMATKQFLHFELKIANYLLDNFTNIDAWPDKEINCINS